MGGVGSAFGKLLLFGEHAAVHGHPAVGVSLPEKTTVWLDDTTGSSPDLGAIPATDRQSVGALLARIQSLIPGPADRGRCSVRIESSVARGVGFGSSAALCSAMARAAIAHAGRGNLLNHEDVWLIAHSAEKYFHGTPSGVDTGLSLLGGTCVFRPCQPALPAYDRVEHPLIWLVAGAVLRDASCGELIGALSRRIATGDAAARSAIEALGGVAAQAASVLRLAGRDLASALARLVDEAMEHLRGLGLSTPALDRVLDAGRAAGALGGKLSGAGAGGAFYLVAEDETSARAVAARVSNSLEQKEFVSPPRVLSVGSP
jgi:mevalonate kinase